MTTTENQVEHVPSEGEEAERYFRYMAEFVGFTPAHEEAIRESRFIIEKHLPEMVAQFYAHLLRYPPTLRFFLKKDGTVNEEYLQLRMQHLTNFWRRTASGPYDEEYARYVDYVGRAHTQRGADPGVYIPERYVIGQVGFIQHAITNALSAELHELDPEWEQRAVKAWNLLMMVLLEMLSRAYSHEREQESFEAQRAIDHKAVRKLAVSTYERGLGISRSKAKKRVAVGRAEEIPEGERRLLEVEGRSVGVFHHKGCWYAVRNRCLHAGGPIAAGSLDGDVLVCPWHGYRYNLTTGRQLNDPSAVLETYPVQEEGGELSIEIPETEQESVAITVGPAPGEANPETARPENQFRLADISPGKVGLVHVDGQRVAVFNRDGRYYATQEACPHASGPLSEGALVDGSITCPWHGSSFDVITGAVERGPARQPLKTYRVVLVGKIGQVFET